MLARAFLALLMGATGFVVAVGEPPGSDPGGAPAWVKDLTGTSQSAATIPWRESSTAQPGSSQGTKPAEFALPAAQSWEVTLGKAAPAGKPVRISAGSAAAGRAVSFQVLDRATTERLGASGFLFRSSKVDGPAKLTIDYSSFADAYGGDYAGRLQLVALPACALDGCAQPSKRMPATNDLVGKQLTADVSELDGVSVYAVTAGVSGEQGTYGATPLSIAGSWQVTPGSGAFTYSYPIDVPKPGGGTAPTVSMGYSSAAIDGLTLASNTQAAPSGIGWSDFANAFIERRYDSCYLIHLSDLCWSSDNAVLSLGGIAGALLPVNAPENTEWKLQSDPGWRIKRNGNASYTTIYGKQSWEVTGPDGTVYIFGGGHMPGRQTNSILSVPVLADNTGEPCRGAGDTLSACEQGWRWYLDRIIDPDGNETAYLYEREQNIYSAIMGIGNNERYHRGALLKEIIYGGRGWDSATYSARVVFELENRCIYLVPECPVAEPGNVNGFPDVPTDLICNSLTKGTCSVHSPSFFTTKRYARVRTEVKVGTGWRTAALHHIRHSWGDGEAGVSRKLRVKELQLEAKPFNKTTFYPATKFGYKVLDNRADHDANIPKAMRHVRINSVTNPFGGVTSVTYGQNRDCPRTYRPPSDPIPRWDQNVRDCFPQEVKDNEFTATGMFNKYLVVTVSEHDGFTAEAMKTTYTYEGDPAWGFDLGAFELDRTKIGWSVWRGYGSVSIRKGTSSTRQILFRGWHRDYVIEKTGTGWALADRLVNVTTSDGDTFVDDLALAGRVLEEQQMGTLEGVAGSVLQKRIHRYEKRLVRAMPGYRFQIEWVGLASTTERIAVTRTTFRDRRSLTTYNVNYQPTSTHEEGWVLVAGDERCSITTYADNPVRNMFVYPAVNKKVAGNCDSANVLTQTQTYYDGSTTLGALPDRGNPTSQRVQLDGGTWAQTTTEFDALGRPLKTTGPTSAAVTTSYAVTAGAPATQIPIRTVVTNALGHQQITDYLPEFGVPSRQQDANGNVTAFQYDAFGRTTAIWLPTETPNSANPSWRFSYDIPNRAIRSQRLTMCCTTVTYEDTWVIYDALWRERQVQGRSTDATKVLISETTYDNRGMVFDQMVEQAFPGTPGKFINGGTSWLNRARHGYDELGREVRQEWLRGGDTAHATVTLYGVDTVTVTGPDGRKVAERIDGLGRTVAIEEYDGSATAAGTYKYDLADRLVSVVDPAGNKIEYSYNMAGWRTGQTDPNRGYAFFGYDLAGRQTAVATESGAIFTNYDVLGRQLERRADSTTGPLLASWQYDTAPGGKGMAHRETNGAGWVSEVLGYDVKGRVTGSKLVVPAGIAGLSGEYSVQHTYDRADRVRSTQLPAIGGLPAETVTTDYSSLGLLTRVAGLEEYVSAFNYDDRGRRRAAAFGPKPGGAAWMAKTWTFDVDQRLNGAQTFVAGSIVSEHQLVFDNSGNLKEKVAKQGGLAWRECFGYDSRARLTSAHTVGATVSCLDGTPGTGDRPYRHAYQYSADGKLLARVEDGVSTPYTYPAAGAARPHAPTRVGNDTLAWDGEGKLVSRTVAGQAEMFAWDKQDRLTSVTGAAGATTFVYDPSGQRLLRRAPDGRSTLYFAGHEITVSASGAPVSSIRPYTLDGAVVATRTLTGVEYLVSDPAGSVEMAYPSGGSTPSATRSYLPYGRARAETGDTATDRGFLGQIEDSSTKLSYLNDRYYDARIGVFISADTLFDIAKVKTLNPYTYASGNPATLSDPSGMYSAAAFGLELENSRLRAINKELIAHIGRLNNQIAELQDIIRKQADAINRMLTYIEALEAEIARQASIIQRLQARVAYLQRVVVAQAREIGRLRGVIAYQQGIIRSQAWVIGYYKGVVNVLGGRLWGGTPFYKPIMDSIHSFRGIPWYGFMVDKVSMLQASVYRLTADRDSWKGRYYGANNTASHLRATISELESENSDLSSAVHDYRDLLNGDWDNLEDTESAWEEFTDTVGGALTWVAGNQEACAMGGSGGFYAGMYAAPFTGPFAPAMPFIGAVGGCFAGVGVNEFLGSQ